MCKSLHDKDDCESKLGCSNLLFDRLERDRHIDNFQLCCAVLYTAFIRGLNEINNVTD
jgi:hypothetical protein